ncbi:MAG TPA: hypothetical protein DDW34_13050 [Clostridium sp.]|nr:hypothetical protein [Clostridium sp.]
METVLALLKIDLGITHNLRDTFFDAQIEACKAEIEGKGITLDLTNVEDQVLLSDFTAWRYRTRTGDMPLANNLHWRIRNRVVKERANYGAT